MSNAITVRLGGAIIALIMFGAPALAASSVDLGNPAFAPTSGPTTIPVGAADFCKREKAACRPNGRTIEAQALTEANWGQLVAINDDVNATIIPETDEDHYHLVEYWTYPDGRGDCEDIALEKQRRLIAAGWDRSTLLMTVVRERSGDGHAVLMVRTDRGDLVLDNQDGRIQLWSDTPYQFVKRQSQADAGTWVAINDNRMTITAAAGAAATASAR